MSEQPPASWWWQDSPDQNRRGRHPRLDTKALRAAGKGPGVWLWIYCHRHSPALAAVVRPQHGEPVLITNPHPEGVSLRRVDGLNVMCPRCMRSETVRAGRVLDAADRLRTLPAKAREVDLDTLTTDGDSRT